MLPDMAASPASLSSCSFSATPACPEHKSEGQGDLSYQAVTDVCAASSMYVDSLLMLGEIECKGDCI